MPLYICKQCYILLCTLICKVYTIECSLPRPCAYTLHSIILIANCNPCNIGQVQERSNCKRMFDLTYKHSGNHVGVHSYFIESASKQYILGLFMYILLQFHENPNLFNRVAVYNSTGKHICL